MKYADTFLADAQATVPLGHCKEIHIGPEGTVVIVGVRPLSECLADWEDQLPRYAGKSVSPESRFLLIVHSWGSTLIQWDDENGEAFPTESLVR